MIENNTSALKPAMQRVDTIECLRGVSALLVVLYHFREFFNDLAPGLGHKLFENGRIGVDIFFVISGFAIYLSTHKYQERKVIPFLARRFFRIVPLAWLLMGVIYWLSPGIPAQTLIKSMLFIPLTHTDPPFFGYNILTPAWTLTYELCFYGMFAVAIALMPKRRGLCVSLLMVSMIVLLQLQAGGSFSLSAYDQASFEAISFGPLWLGLMANPLFLEFLCGVLIAYVYLHHPGLLLKLPAQVRISLYLFLIAFFFSHFFSGLVMGHGLDRKGAAAVALFLFYLSAHSDPLLAWCRDTLIPGPGGLLRFLGKISFSLYVVHEVIHQFIYRIPLAYPLFDQTGGLGKFVTLLSFSIFFAYVLYNLVEVPCQNLGRRVALKFLPSPYKVPEDCSAASTIVTSQ